MNMLLTEWNKSCEYADNVCANLPITVKPEPYTMYDGRVGIHLNVYDAKGKVYATYSTGTHNSFEEMKQAIDKMIVRIMREV